MLFDPMLIDHYSFYKTHYPQLYIGFLLIDLYKIITCQILDKLHRLTSMMFPRSPSPSATTHSNINILESFTDVKELDIDLLKTGNYTSINRFDRPIVKAEKVGAKINPSRTACMLKVNTYDLHKNYSLIDNCIYLSPIKNK